jgi:hypothetical protein
MERSRLEQIPNGISGPFRKRRRSSQPVYAPPEENQVGARYRRSFGQVKKKTAELAGLSERARLDGRNRSAGVGGGVEIAGEGGLPWETVTWMRPKELVISGRH